jgi:hypothetical protein
MLDKIDENAVDLRVDVPFLAALVESTADELSRGTAVSTLGRLALRHAFAGEAFRPAADVFARLAAQALPPEKAKWEKALVAMHAFAGMQPNADTLSIVYRMVDEKSAESQALGLLALTRMKPIPPRAKETLMARLVKMQGKVSGTTVIGPLMAYAFDDAEVPGASLKALVAALDGEDAEEHQLALQLLSKMGSHATSALGDLRRIARRAGLDEDLKSDLRRVIAMIEGTPPGGARDR